MCVSTRKPQDISEVSKPGRVGARHRMIGQQARTPKRRSICGGKYVSKLCVCRTVRVSAGGGGGSPTVGCVRSQNGWRIPRRLEEALTGEK